MFMAKSLNTNPKIEPDNPKANNLMYDNTSPRRPVAMLYVSHNPEPMFLNGAANELIGPFNK